MNSIIRNLIVATPLAAAAVTLAPAASMAADGHIAVAQLSGTHQGPSDFTAPVPGPTPPKGPGDFTAPEPGPTTPDGPDDFTAPQPCPTHGACGPDGGGDDFEVPTRVDAGAASQGGDIELSWLLVGGGVVTASGIAFASSRRRRSV